MLGLQWIDDYQIVSVEKDVGMLGLWEVLFDSKTREDRVERPLMSIMQLSDIGDNVIE